MIAVTGIYLNHKDTFHSILGGPTKEDEHKGPSGQVGLPHVVRGRFVAHLHAESPGNRWVAPR